MLVACIPWHTPVCDCPRYNGILEFQTTNPKINNRATGTNHILSVKVIPYHPDVAHNLPMCSTYGVYIYSAFEYIWGLCWSILPLWTILFATYSHLISPFGISKTYPHGGYQWKHIKKKNTTHLQQISKSTGFPNVSHITIPYAQQPPSAARHTLSHLLTKCSDGAVFSNLGLKLGDAPPIYKNFHGKPEDLPDFFW